MRIVFCIDSFEDGGAARVVSSVGQELVKRGQEVFVATNTVHRKINYGTGDGISFCSLYGENHYRYPSFLRIWLLVRNARRVMKQVRPDVVVGVHPIMFVICWLASWGLSIPVIASDHTSFARHLPRYMNFIRFYLYRYAQAVTILSHADADFLGKRLPKKTVLPNPLSYPIYEGDSCRRKNILAVGRLNVWRVKGFDLLIEAWGKIAADYPDWQLEIAGTGDKQKVEELRQLAMKCEVLESVKWLGFCLDIEKVMQESSIFVLSSREEGFGLVLLEAMSQGCACISFDDKGRQGEIITSPQSGVLLAESSAERLAAAMRQLIENEGLRKRLGEGAKAEAKRFDVNKITDRWEELFLQVSKNK